MTDILSNEVQRDLDALISNHDKQGLRLGNGSLTSKSTYLV